jgi:hypothetical protein
VACLVTPHMPGRLYLFGGFCHVAFLYTFGKICLYYLINEFKKVVLAFIIMVGYIIIIFSLMLVIPGIKGEHPIFYMKKHFYFLFLKSKMTKSGGGTTQK